MTQSTRLLATCLITAVAGVLVSAAGQDQDSQERFRFRTGVELINVTATVVDQNGRFVSGLRREDFRVYEDGVEQPITHFDNERVPVSLGIALDTSGSMAGEKIRKAREALNRFLFDLLDASDEAFLYRFDANPELVEGWTTDRSRISRELARIQPRGGTAMYDAVAEAVPMAQSGRHKKKALVLISDGNDTASQTDVGALKQMIRETEVLVYAIGLDAQGGATIRTRPPVGGGTFPPRPPRVPIPLPFPFPGRRPPSQPPRGPATPPPGTVVRGADERVNVAALRDLTDDSGGRTEIIRSAGDLDPATAGIAHELSQQYYLGYPASGKNDGMWHSIRVEVKNREYRVRARRGYIAASS